MCPCSARRCWLFLLEPCCVSGTVTAVSSANVISCSVGCESISFRGTIIEDCWFFSPHPSNHNIWIESLCAAQHTEPEWKHISSSVLLSYDVYDRLFLRKKKKCLQTKVFASVSLNLKYCILLPFFYFFLWVNKFHTWPWWTLTQSVYIVRAGKSNNTRDGWRIKPHTFSH